MDWAAGPPLDLGVLDDTAVVAACQRCLRGMNYINVILGSTAASVCVSRARLCYADPETGEDRWVDYLGISTVESAEPGKGHFRALVDRLLGIARRMGRALAITEIRTQRMREILERHPDVWLTVLAPSDMLCPNFVRV